MSLQYQITQYHLVIHSWAYSSAGNPPAFLTHLRHDTEESGCRIGENTIFCAGTMQSYKSIHSIDVLADLVTRRESIK